MATNIEASSMQRFRIFLEYLFIVSLLTEKENTSDGYFASGTSYYKTIVGIADTYENYSKKCTGTSCIFHFLK